MENNNENLIMLLTERLDSLLSKVNEIKETLDTSRAELNTLDKEIIELRKDNELQNTRIDRLENSSKAMKNWITGLAASVIAGILVAALKVGFGL